MQRVQVKLVLPLQVIHLFKGRKSGLCKRNTCHPTMPDISRFSTSFLWKKKYKIKIGIR